MVKIVLPQMALRFPKAVKTDLGKKDPPNTAINFKPRSGIGLGSKD